ncbi:armadillo repeat-containing protein 5 [Pholidichthys leucotaenia]
MASPTMQAERKPSYGAPTREGHPSPESSLTWCLAHISKTQSGSECQVDSGGSRETDKKSTAYQWRALVAIRTQHIKGGKADIARFRSRGGLQLLLDLLKNTECPRKTLDLGLSILANCCTELETRLEVRKLDGISIIVDILKRNMALETVQNRAARALGNLAMDAESSALIHSAGGVPLLLICMSVPSASSPTSSPPKDTCPKLECAQSSARALLYLCDTPSNRLSLLTQGAFSALAPLIAPEYPQGLRRAALRTLHELTRGCGAECARDVSRSGVLAQLGIMGSGESGKPFEELALKTLANVCSQGCLRPLVGSLGVIKKFIEEVKRDPLKSGVFIKALCLCCKEAVNRAKVKEGGGLEVLISFLSSHQSHPLSRFIILACVDFVFDESAIEQLLELGLVPLLVARLVNLTRGEEQQPEKMDVSFSSSSTSTELLPSSCFDSFDFPPLEGNKREDAGRDQGSSSFLSLRSWLVSEGLISSEGDLLDSSHVEGEWGTHQIPPSSSSSPQTSSPNPNSSTSLKNSSSSSPAVFSASKKAAQPSPVSSSSPCKVTDSPPSIAFTPQTPSTPSILSSPTMTSQTPVSPSKFSSPHRRRQRLQSSVNVTKVTLDMPPSVPRPSPYRHPYHPEPWTPESPILLLLSRFSHDTDPSAALINSGVMSGLVYYLTQHQDPSSRCFRMLCRLSCNPNCLQALIRTGSVALIHHHLCQREDELEGEERQTDRVKAKVRQLGIALLNNLRVQCESGFGSGVLAHVMLSGSESDKMNCALSLPIISSNKSLLKKLLVDSGGLLLALQPLGCDNDDDMDGDHPCECGRLLSDLFNSKYWGETSHLHSLYFSLLIGCLSAVMSNIKTELKIRHTIPVVAQFSKMLPPPSKRPRLTDTCQYTASSFDLILLLDDGTRMQASREAVRGVTGTDGNGSEYFRALLRGGFGEAHSDAEDAIHIKDVSAGMLLPVLHYLHGCRLNEDAGREGRCLLLDMLALDWLKDTEKPSEEDVDFQKTSLGEVMVGACRFLVTELQRELEDVCVSFLLSWSTKSQTNAEKAASKMDQESAEENLASRTSELELTGSDNVQNISPQQTDIKKSSLIGAQVGPNKTLDKKLVGRVAPVSKALDPEEFTLRPKDLPTLGSDAASDSVLAALLPQMYWFSQQYSYPTLGRVCLSLLLGSQDRPPILSSSLAGDCLRRLAREADCTETLKRDLLSLVSVALS